jgi:2-methylaconitate cis-trans-isomerase PrpF
MAIQLRIPCTLMRGGTSRGPVFLATDLPVDTGLRDEVLLSILGSGNELQINGLGGGNPLTSKVAIVGPPTHPDADVDYLFAQVKVVERVVDTSPNCGNMLSTVGPFAIEKGLVAGQAGHTRVVIHNVNTGQLVAATVQTPSGRPVYDGDTVIDGVPGSGAPVELEFLGVAGAKTGKLLPTGAAIDLIEGVEVSCIDAAMPLVVIEAAALGKTGSETPAELDADRAFMARLEHIRRRAGRLMGLGDVSGLVIPKPVLIGRPQKGGTITARYFMPHACHKAFAVTGAVGLGTACGTPGTLAHRLVGDAGLPRRVVIEHPSGRIEVAIDRRGRAATAAVLRTTKPILEGIAFAQVQDRPVTLAA